MTKIDVILQYFDEIIDNAKCELVHSNAFELTIAVLLSAQTTDKSVNKITTILFDKYKTPSDYINEDIENIIEILRPLGMQYKKSNQIIKLCESLNTNFMGEVPTTRAKLEKLPGVGRKTASVILGEWFKIPAFPVDTHVERVSKRLTLVNETDSVRTIEDKLCELIKEKHWIKCHHQFILFGRYFCKAKKPLCGDCRLKNYCKEFN